MRLIDKDTVIAMIEQGYIQTAKDIADLEEVKALPADRIPDRFVVSNGWTSEEYIKGWNACISVLERLMKDA